MDKGSIPTALVVCECSNEIAKRRNKPQLAALVVAEHQGRLSNLGAATGYV